MSKMKVAGSKVVDIAELLTEISEELSNKDSFDTTNPYEIGMRDELVWVQRKLQGLSEVVVCTSSEMAYEKMK